MFLNLFKERFHRRKKSKSKSKKQSHSKSQSQSFVDNDNDVVLKRMNAKKHLIKEESKNEILKPKPNPIPNTNNNVNNNDNDNTIFHFLSTLHLNSKEQEQHSQLNNNNKHNDDDDKDKQIQKLKNEIKSLKETMKTKQEERWSDFIDTYIDNWFDKNKSDVNIGVIDVYGMFKIDVLPDEMEKYIYKKILKIIVSMMAEVKLN